MKPNLPSIEYANTHAMKITEKYLNVVLYPPFYVSDWWTFLGRGDPWPRNALICKCY